MLYCPKCNQSYEDGVQRFCTNDNTRLVPAAGAGSQPRSVFTSVLNRAAPNQNRSSMFTEVPVLTKPEQKSPAAIPFQPVKKDSVQSIDAPPVQVVEAQEETTVGNENIPAPEISLPPAKPAARLIRPNEVPSSQAALGDRAVHPSGREALTWDNPKVLIGQTIKGRYVVAEQLGEDETGFVYLANDKIPDGKKVVVRILLEEDAEDLSSRILAEERMRLSHVNHPNVAHLFDSGELHEGFPFVVAEYVDGKSLKEQIGTTEEFNLQRVARIVRQAANAVGEAHRNGVLHRNLKPKNIILGINEAGAEQVKVTDFGVFDGFEAQNEENVAYLAPEQLAENYPTSASDIYSLAVIAFQLLTGRLPFEFSTVKELSKAQKEKLKLLPTNLRNDLSLLVDEILEKALASEPSERYPKARDFGDAFYNAIVTNAPAAWTKEDGKYKVKDSSPSRKNFAIPKPLKSLLEEKSESAAKKLSVKESKTISPAASTVLTETETSLPEADKNKPSESLPWEKRSPEPIKAVNGWRVGAIVLGILILSAAVWGIWNYFLQRPEQPIYAPPKTETANQNSSEPPPAENAPSNTAPIANLDAPPQPRDVEAPPNTTRFENSKAELKGDLLKNFRGFAFYYPKDWVKNPSQTNFVDVARVGATGTPIEQMLVSYYESHGTMATDETEFPKLVEKSNKDLAAIIFDYKMVSKGETTINGWKAYEVKFEGSGKTVNGDKITLWGRRLWIPPARLDVKTGFLITLLATSNSPEVKSADDVGVKGELAGVLATFEPTPIDTGY